MPVIRLPYLMQMAAELGLYEQTWQDVVAWSSACRITLTPWESRALVEICAEYTSGVLAYNGKEAPPPWVDPEKINRNAIADSVRRALG